MTANNQLAVPASGQTNGQIVRPVSPVQVNGMDLAQLGRVLATSGYFQDATEEAKAIVKVLAGAEMGFGPIASMTGIHIIEGKPSVSANLMASGIKRCGKYNYRIVRSDDEECIINFFENGELVGTTSCTMEEAKTRGFALGRDGLKKNWRMFPSDMLFARALSRGQRRYCPDSFDGPVYTPDEMGAEVDEEGNAIGLPRPASVPKGAAAPSSRKQNELMAAASAASGNAPSASATAAAAKPAGAPKLSEEYQLSEPQEARINQLAKDIFGDAREQKLAELLGKELLNHNEVEAAGVIKDLEKRLAALMDNRPPSRAQAAKNLNARMAEEEKAEKEARKQARADVNPAESIPPAERQSRPQDRIWAAMTASGLPDVREIRLYVLNEFLKLNNFEPVSSFNDLDQPQISAFALAIKLDHVGWDENGTYFIQSQAGSVKGNALQEMADAAAKAEGSSE